MIWFRNALKSFLDIRRNAFDVLCVCVALLGTTPCHALDQYTDGCTSTTGWTGDSTSGTFTAVSWEGSTVFKAFCATAGAGNNGSAYRTLSATGDVVKIKFDIDNDNIGTIAATNNFVASYYGGAYVTPIRFGTDGMTIGGAGELGTDIVDVGVKTTWEIYLKGANTSTGSATVYKNGIYVGVLSNVTSASTARAAGTLTLRQQATSLANATTYVDNLTVESWGLNYRANDTTLNGWTDGDSGNGVSSQISGAMNFTVSSAASGATALRTATITSAMPSKVILEAKVKNNTLGLIADNNHFAFLLRRKDTQFVGLYFDSSGLYRRTGVSTYTEIGTDIVTTGTADTWRFFVDFDSDKIYVWKNGVFQAGGLACVYTTTAIGYLSSLTQLGYTVKGDTDVYYYVLSSEDGTLIQTIIE